MNSTIRFLITLILMLVAFVLVNQLQLPTDKGLNENNSFYYAIVYTCGSFGGIIIASKKSKEE